MITKEAKFFSLSELGKKELTAMIVNKITIVISKTVIIFKIKNST